MAWIGTRTYLALDALAVAVAEVAEGVSREKLARLAHEPLPPGAVVPGATSRNLADAAAVEAAIARALAGVTKRRVTLVLPDGVARLALLEPPQGVPASDYVRYRLAASLPWPAAEATFEFLDAGGGRVVGAAVRRETVAEYEQALSAAGATVERVHLAPLLALDGLRREPGPEAVHALLGDVAMCLARVCEGRILALRCRRRDRSQGEAARLRAELLRLAGASANGNGSLPLAVSGSDASRLRPSLAPEGTGGGEAAPPSLTSGAEACWLRGLVR